MKQIYLRCLLPLLLSCLSFPCAAATISIRIINSKTGQPLQNQRVAVVLLYDKGEKIPLGYAASSQLETDANGEAQLSLPEPPPSHLGITVHLTSEHWHCACSDLAETQTVIQNGILVGETDNKLKIGNKIVQAEPGEVIFAARPFTFLEKLLYPLVKG